MSGKVYNGADWEDVVDKVDDTPGKETPLHPILDGDGNIFVSIPSFRDGERCGKTLVELFAKAKQPDKVMVGLVEQAYEEDTFCIEAYCKEMGVEIYNRVPIRVDTTKIVAKPNRKTCPHIDQIRKLSVHNVAAKGPVWARSMTRKVLGNEEFCMQIDAHMKFVQDWDAIAKQEWAATGNEFGIISTVPAALDQVDKDIHEVPRHCLVKFVEVGVPQYTARGDGLVKDLKKPLLAHAWSAGFSFSKCHLEESAPYDPFTPYIMGVEQFARYARFWTRGYDVYTPTQNIVYHNYQENPDGHNTMEWMKPRKERFRKAGIKRIKSYLWLPGGESESKMLANLGIYGLGKRRTLKQLADFVGLDMEEQKSRPQSMSCANNEWVPYDLNISPVDNLFDQPDDLDPQPEYPLRTKMAFYKEEEWNPPPSLEILEGDVAAALAKEIGKDGEGQQHVPDSLPTSVESSRYPSGSLIFVLWVLGLIAWCSVFMGGGSSSSGKKKRPRRKKETSFKEV